MTTNPSRGASVSQACNFTTVVSSTGPIHSGDKVRARWARQLEFDLDPVVVDRLIAGQPTAHTAWERREATRRLRLAGHTHAHIAAQLHIDRQQVLRDLARAGLTDPGARGRLLEQTRRRRVVVAQLVDAGVTTGEIALLLGATRRTIGGDRNALGVTAQPSYHRALRSLPELRRTYGHLLALDVEAGVA